MTKAEPIKAPMQAVVHAVNVAAGDSVSAGQELVILEAMKMQHALAAPVSGTVKAIQYDVGEVVKEGAVVFSVEAGEAAGDATAAPREVTREVTKAAYTQYTDEARGVPGRVRCSLQEDRRPAVVLRRRAGAARKDTYDAVAEYAKRLRRRQHATCEEDFEAAQSRYK